MSKSGYTKKLAFIAMMACIIAICSWITVPSTVPFTLQTFAVFCAVLLLGGKDGTFAVALYILLGCVGLPVFSGFSGGIGHLLGLTGGYIIGFLFTTLEYMLFEPLLKKNKKLTIPVLVFGLILCYAIGTLWFAAVSSMNGNSRSINAILIMCVYPYIIPDIIKLFLALGICNRVKKALPKQFDE